MAKPKQMSENFILGIILAAAGGYLDAYTYLVRGGVFANAQTGNIVLLGINIAKGCYSKILQYLLPIIAFSVGILIAEALKGTLNKNRFIHWRQISIAVEIILLFSAAFIPYGKHNIIVNTIISLVCALQVESFRVINGSTVATTMCTGNLRSATQLLFIGMSTKNKLAIKQCLNYYGIILFFIIGAIAGALITNHFGTKSIFACCILLFIPFIMMFKRNNSDIKIKQI